MAKSDFCFTYYDGDATREMAHMNRLERGAYTDVIIQLRQRGRLTIDDLKKFLSKDFDSVWPALEWILKKDEKGFFIEWLENSIQRAATFSKIQSERKSGSSKQQPKTDSDKPNRNQKGIPVNPLGDGDEYGDGIGIKQESGNENFLVPEMCKVWYASFAAYTSDKESDFEGMGKVLQFISRQANLKNIPDADDQIKILNTLQLIADQVNREPFWVNKPIKSIANNIQEFYNKIKNPVNGKQSAGKGTLREQVQAERDRRRKAREQTGA